MRHSDWQLETASPTSASDTSQASNPVDIMGTSGNKHVIVFYDHLTKWPMVYPLPDQKTSRIVETLVYENIPFYGVPESLLSDCRTNLLPYLMRDVCGLLGIRKLNTTT